MIIRFDLNSKLKRFNLKIFKEFVNRSSGAYIFRPNSTDRIVSDKVMTTVIKGPVVEEVHQVSCNSV